MMCAINILSSLAKVFNSDMKNVASARENDEKEKSD